MATQARAFDPNDPNEAMKLFAGKASIGADGKLKASADYLGNGAIEINAYESEILDLIRRNSPTLTRLKNAGACRRAKGQPHRYFEQTAVASATATDPRNITPTPSGPTRVERPAFIKAVTAQSNFSHFDVEVTQQQGNFAEVEAKDIADIATAIVRKNAQMLWTGTDTSLSAPTTLEWVGLLTQLIAGGNVAFVDHTAASSSIIDAIKSEVALLVSNTNYEVMPTCVLGNPIALDLIDQEAKEKSYKFNEIEFIAGVKVNGIQTQSGVLPLGSDPWIPKLSKADAIALFGIDPASVPAGANYCSILTILSEREIEIPYVNPNGDDTPRIFQLGLLAGLQGQFVGISYCAVILKAAGYAHAVIGIWTAA